MFHATIDSHHPFQRAQRAVKSSATLGLVVLIGIQTRQASTRASKGICVPIRF